MTIIGFISNYYNNNNNNNNFNNNNNLLTYSKEYLHE